MIQQAPGEASAPRITSLLDAWNAGDHKACDSLAVLLESDLNRIARGFLGRENRNHTLETGALVNEAFMVLLRHRKLRLKNRHHFLRVFAILMRRKLVDHARRKKAAKRGAGVGNVEYQDELGIGPWTEESILRLDDALKDLSRSYPQGSQIVEMRFFGGLNSQEIAEILGVHPQTVHNRWRTAKLWLYRYLNVRQASSIGDSQAEVKPE